MLQMSTLVDAFGSSHYETFARWLLACRVDNFGDRLLVLPLSFVVVFLLLFEYRIAFFLEAIFQVLMLCIRPCHTLAVMPRMIFWHFYQVVDLDLVVLVNTGGIAYHVDFLD